MKPSSTSDFLVFAGGRLPLTGKIPLVMGILNAAPDSFSDGGTPLSKRLDALFSEGADMIDLGGESTRPGAACVPADEELRRLLPVLREIRKRSGIPVSIDTRKACVAKACLDEGADIINDVSNLNFDPELVNVTAQYKAGLILNHSRGTPDNMQQRTDYPEGLLPTVCRELAESAEKALAAGVGRDSIVLDPGLGFAKDFEQTETLIREPGMLLELGYPLLSGPSRKGFIGFETGEKIPEKRDYGTCGAVIASMIAGYRIIRVHNVKAAKDAMNVFAAIRG